MKKYYLWILVAVAVVLFFVGSMQKGTEYVDDSMMTEEKEVVVENKAPTNSGSTSSVPQPGPVNLFPQKGNYQCVYETVTPNSRSTNTVYLSNGKMRGEFRSSTPDGSVTNMVVYDGKYLYVWLEGMNVGKITEPKSLADFPSIVPINITEGKILGDGYNSVSYDCYPWSKIDSYLQKPTYVNFSF